MSKFLICFGCGAPIRRGYPMVTKEGEKVIICGKCNRLWLELKAEEKESGNDKGTECKGAEDSERL